MSTDRHTLLPLPLIALVGALILAGIYLATAPRIEANRQRAADRIVLDALALPADTGLRAAGVAPDASKRVLLARQKQQLVAIVVPVTVEGYVAPIDLIVGIAPDGKVSGVSAVSHRETAGLGDRIDADKSGWLKTFIGRSFDAQQARIWSLRADGGDFDQITGATVTSRAVIDAVRTALQYFAQHREQLLQEAGDE